MEEPRKPEANSAEFLERARLAREAFVALKEADEEKDKIENGPQVSPHYRSLLANAVAHCHNTLDIWVELVGPLKEYLDEAGNFDNDPEDKTRTKEMAMLLGLADSEEEASKIALDEVEKALGRRNSLIDDRSEVDRIRETGVQRTGESDVKPEDFDRARGVARKAKGDK